MKAKEKKSYAQLVEEARARSRAYESKIKASPTYEATSAEWDAEYAIHKAMAEARERANLTQAQLAERMESSQATVSRAMRGNVTLSTLIKWFSACDCDLHITAVPRQLSH